MFVSFQKLFVKESPPLSVEKFSVAVSKKHVIEFATEIFCQKVFKFIWELGAEIRKGLTRENVHLPPESMLHESTYCLPADTSGTWIRSRKIHREAIVWRHQTELTGLNRTRT